MSRVGLGRSLGCAGRLTGSLWARLPGARGRAWGRARPPGTRAQPRLPRARLTWGWPAWWSARRSGQTAPRPSRPARRPACPMAQPVRPEAGLSAAWRSTTAREASLAAARYASRAASSNAAACLPPQPCDCPRDETGESLTQGTFRLPGPPAPDRSSAAASSAQDLARRPGVDLHLAAARGRRARRRGRSASRPGSGTCPSGSARRRRTPSSSTASAASRGPIVKWPPIGRRARSGR